MTGRDGRRGKEHSGGIPWRACKSERAQNRTPQWVEVDSSPQTSWTVRNWAAGAVPQEVPPSTMTTKAQSYLMSSAEVSTMAATNNLPVTIGGVATGALYDPQGNLTQLFGTPGQSTSLVTMTYDTLGRVATLGDTANATSQAYLYDDEGLRIKAVDLKSGLTTYNIYNEARQLVATYTRVGSGSLTWKRDILYVGARELAEVSATGTAVVLTDHLGTPRYSWNGSGIPTKQKFLPFGESLAPADDSAKFAKGFTNHEQTDSSGLVYMQARFYAPMYGRFLSPDPARDQHFEQTQSWNIYSYVRNMPTMSIDPTGMLTAAQLAAWSRDGDSALYGTPDGGPGYAASSNYGTTAQTSGIIASGFSLSGLNGQAFAAPGGVFIKGADLASSSFVSANNNGRVDLNNLASVSGANFEMKDGAANTFMATQSAANLYNTAAAYGKAFPGSDKLVVTDAGTASGAPAKGHDTHNGSAVDVRYQDANGRNIQSGFASAGMADVGRMSRLVSIAKSNGFSYNLSSRPADFRTSSASQKVYNNHRDHLHMGKHLYETP